MSRLVLTYVYAVDAASVYFRKVRGIVQHKGQQYCDENVHPLYIQYQWEKVVEEEQLQQRLEKLKALERELKEKEKAVKAKEKSLKEKDKAKKQMVLRLSPTLWNEIAAWAEEDFRSINGQVEYLLSECVRKRKGG